MHKHGVYNSILNLFIFIKYNIFDSYKSVIYINLLYFLLILGYFWLPYNIVWFFIIYRF